MSGDIRDQRAIAAATVEVAVRRENEEVEPAPEAGWDLGLIDYDCECGNPACELEVRLTRAEYEGVRERPRRFAVVPGHVILAAEHVVERHPRYVVVEKDRVAGAIAEAADPRG